MSVYAIESGMHVVSSMCLRERDRRETPELQVLVLVTKLSHPLTRNLSWQAEGSRIS